MVAAHPAAVALGQLLVPVVGKNLAQVPFRAWVASFVAYFTYQVTQPSPMCFVPPSKDALTAFLEQIAPWLQEAAAHSRVEPGVVQYSIDGQRLVFCATPPAAPASRNAERVHLYIPIRDGTGAEAQRILRQSPLGCSLAGSRHRHLQASLVKEVRALGDALMQLVDTRQKNEFC